MARYRIGIDIGGTFTDFVLEDLTRGTLHLGKTLTTPADPSEAVIEGLQRLLRDIDADAAEIGVIVHGTTLATNAVIERTGAPTGLLTTEGFVDVLAIGRESRYDYYDLQMELPEPLVPRALRRGVPERVDRDGKVVRTLDRDALAREVTALAAAGVKSIAVSYLHAYRNPVHERASAEYIASAVPRVSVSLSSEVAPEIREFERTSTTVINAYLQPILEHYLARLHERLRALGFRGEFHLMLSSGLLTTADRARRFPARLIESGPAGGAMLGEFYAQLTGQRHLIAFDMGGTTAKASLIHDGEVAVAREFEVGRIDRFKRGSGFPVRTPCVDIEEIGTGGGSIASIDRLGQLKVGPRSAGSVPGPACYGRGGTQPTVTDADLVLGYLDPNYFLGGEMRLDADAAARAVTEHIAAPLGLSLEQAAWGIHRVANEDMANAFRIHAMEQGRDPSRYALLCFGGAGPVHAFGVARTLRTASILSPASAGVASALGFLVAPVAAEHSRSYVARLDRLDWPRLNALLDELERTGRAFLSAAGIAPEAVRVTRAADMQYVGQMHDIAVSVPNGALAAHHETALRDAFYARYRELFQRFVTRIPVEALTWRVTVSAPAPRIELRRRDRSAAAARKGSRRAYFPDAGGYADTAVYDRYRLRAGDQLAGPAIVEERESTLVVGPAGSVTVDEYGSLIVATA
jgi:N-methylhydantoinase A/oxoprolinase/acetone carboxylase beta subunit